jgi:hypothetical protein
MPQRIQKALEKNGASSTGYKYDGTNIGSNQAKSDQEREDIRYHYFPHNLD